MDLEYVKGVLLVRINIFNKEVNNKLYIYLTNILEKYEIKYVVVNLNNIESNSNLTDAILNIKYTLDRWDGTLYLCGIKTCDFAKLNRLHIKITSFEKTALKRCER